jgi:glycosyltransferase involved in cell wall biosynthesis
MKQAESKKLRRDRLDEDSERHMPDQNAVRTEGTPIGRRPVQVLLSTYNGERYLGELLDSLAGQSHGPLSLLARDDGSSDSTLEILRRYTGVERKDVIAGDHLGVVGGYFDLLRRSSDSSAFFAFCDQDDVWERNKLTRAIQVLDQSAQRGAAMYCSRTKNVDENLSFLASSRVPRRRPSFQNALVENIAPGCTLVINKAARDLLLRHTPRSAVMHDAWIYLVLAGCGQVVFDNESHILYRQHRKNVVGVETRVHKRWLRRIRHYLVTPSRGWSDQAVEFLASYAAILSREKERTLRDFVNGTTGSWWRRLGYAFTCDVRRQSRVDSFFLRGLIMLGRI